jgi:hypothetical protein
VKAWAWCLCACLAILGEGSARADEEAGLGGRFGFVIVGRNNLGEIGDQYRSGLLFGVHAGLELNVDESPWSVGLGWTTLVRGYYFASSAVAIDQTVDITEMNLGVSLRRGLGSSPHHVIGSIGGAFSASNVPLPPGNERRYLGLYSGVGYGRRLWGQWFWSLESRYATYYQGPSNLSVFMSMTAGFGK